MSATANQYQPDYAVPPGWMLAERLDAQRISQAEFARRCGRSPKLISQIISGDAPVEPSTALQFQRVLGVDASIWLGIESDYRLHRAREAERQKTAKAMEWAERFPVAELVRRKAIAKPSSPEESVLELLSFFGVGSREAWENRQLANVAYKHSLSFRSDSAVLATWLRLGEIEAERMECPGYNEVQFRRALVRVRSLTAHPSSGTLREAQHHCQGAGVALTIGKPLPKTTLSSASRWLHPDKAAIHLTTRHLSDDQLWVSLFHEAAHLLLHSKKHTFVHEANGRPTEAEAEADKWAADFLVHHRYWAQFVAAGDFTSGAVRTFSEQQGIAPGIVVGRLQHEKHLDWHRLNELKVKLKWTGDTD